MRKLLLLIAAASVCRADQLEDTLDRLDKAASSFKTMTANLKQTAHTAVINEDNVESGTIRIKRPKPGDTRMLVEFTEPDVKSVLLQGSTLSIYLPKIKTVQEYEVGKNRSMIEQFLLLGFGTSRKELAAANEIQFGGEETRGGKPAVRLDLTPKGEDVRKHVSKIELWISPETGYPLGHKIYQPGGDYQLFEFSNLQINVNLPDSAFKLNLPKDVKKERPQG